MENKKIILHVCCAICGAYLVDYLKDKYKEIVLYFYNPNIHPEEEYKKRFESVKKLADISNLELIEGRYNDKDWFSEVKGLESQPEGGKRCEVCFNMRLEEVAKMAIKEKREYFTTTLAASSYKDEILIDQIGKKIAKKYNLQFINPFIDNEFKKSSLQKARQISREAGFYHQKYCGCLFSQKK